MGLTSFPGAKTERSGPARIDPDPAGPGERKGVRDWLAAAPEALSRLLPRSSGAATRGARSNAGSGGGFDLRRHGPILLFAGLGLAVLAGIVFLGAKVVGTAFEKGPSAVVERPLDGSTDAPPIAAGEVPAAIGQEQQGAAAASKNAQTAAPAVEASNDWILPLTRRQISRYYPQRALEKGIQGAATLRCSFRQPRYPDCTVLRETPDGWRFGSAARRLSRQFEPTAEAVSGQPFSVTVKFRMER